MKLLQKLIAGICIILSFGQNVSVFFYGIATAQSPALPIFTVYRDTAGGENITPSAQALSWDTEVLESAEIPLNAGNDSLDLSVGGHYLVMYSVPIRSTGGGNRSETQTWLQLNGSTDLEYGYGSSYIRRADNDFEGYNEGSAIIEASPGDDLSVMIQKTDSNSATMERTPDRSGINVLKLDDAWNYARLRPTSAQAVTTTWSQVDISTSDELDSTSFGLSGNELTLKEIGKYLVTYNVATVTTGTDRTNNEMRLTLDDTEIPSTRSTAYIRAQNGSFTGISSFVGVVDVTSANQILELEMRRESTLQGTTNNTVVSKTGLSVVKLPDSADYVRISETTGGQDISPTANTPVTFDTTDEQGTQLAHDTGNPSEIDINTDGNYIFLHSIYNARSDTSNGPRENPYLEWQVNGVTLKYGNSGSYNRSSNDGDGISNSSHSSAGIIVPGMNLGDTIELTETNEASNGGSTYQGGRMGVQAINLESLFTGAAYFTQPSYRWRDDSVDFDTDSGWLAAESTSITDIQKSDDLRLRIKVENPSSFVYDEDSQFELQWAQTAASCRNGLSWSPVSSTGSAFDMYDSSNISPNGETSSSVFLSNPNGNTHIISEGYHAPDGQTFLSSANTFTANSQKEYEFSLRPSSSALGNTVYCFRLFDIEAGLPLSVSNFPRLQMGSTGVILDNVWGEAGKITAPANGGWTTVTYTGGPYTNPVIVGRSNTQNDPNEALVFEARNVTSTGAEVRLCDSNSGNSTGCQTHLEETIGYIVVDAAETNSIDGIEAGTFIADESFDTAAGEITTTYTESFSSIPYVFTSIQSTNGDSPIVTRVEASTLTNFRAGICQQNSTDGCNGSHPNETVGWIAIDPSINPFYKEMDIGTGDSQSPSNLWTSVGFSTTFSTVPVGISQTVTNNGGQDVQIDELQSITTSGMEFRACELDTDDDCDTHAIDTIRWLAIEEGIFAAEYFLDETHYRWYENIDNITPTTPLGGDNSTLTSIPANDQLRLRILLQNSDPELPLGILSIKLQYASGATCSSLTTWTDVGNPGGTEDWNYYDNPTVADGATITSSLLSGGGHVLQNYSESNPSSLNPNPIPLGEWGEWDFALEDNTGISSKQYCFRVVTQDGDEISYAQYAQIDTTDATAPSIDSFSPDSDILLPIGNFDIDYTFSDVGSGINTSSALIILQKWNGSSWGSDISGSFISLDVITTGSANYAVTNLPYGRYRVGFEIYDNSGNFDNLVHELYVDEIEFIISDFEHDIGTITNSGTLFDSPDEITISVRTVGAEFSVYMQEDIQLGKSGELIEHWDGSIGYGYKTPPYTGNPTSSATQQNLGGELRNLNPNGDKYTYEYRVKFSALLSELTNYSAGDYEANYSFGINLDYE